MDQSIRVLAVDDHAFILDALRGTLSEIPGVVLVDEDVTTGQGAVEATLRLQPDVVIMDINLGANSTLNGIEATRQITAQAPRTKVLMFTMEAGRQSLIAAMRAGARGYITKGDRASDVASALEAVMLGRVVFSSDMSDIVLETFSGPAPVVFPELTDREREILEQMAAGMDNAQIARKLFLASKTVRNYVTSIFTKLGVNSRQAAVDMAREAGMGSRGASGRPGP